MAPKYDSEDKCAFLPYDCVPGRIAWVAFKQNLFANGGRGNDWGDTLAHAFMGTNTGGVNGIAHAGTASDVRKFTCHGADQPRAASAEQHEHRTLKTQRWCVRCGRRRPERWGSTSRSCRCCST